MAIKTISIADKDTLDKVFNNTDILLNTSLYKYSTFNDSFNIKNNTINVWETIKEISGEGYLLNCVLTANACLRITVDESIVYENTYIGVGGSNSACGLIHNSFLYSYGTSTPYLGVIDFSGISENTLRLASVEKITSMPYIGKEYSKCSIIFLPIFFKNNLKVEAKINDNAVNYRMNIFGGLKI